MSEGFLVSHVSLLSKELRVLLPELSAKASRTDLGTWEQVSYGHLRGDFILGEKQF